MSAMSVAEKNINFKNAINGRTLTFAGAIGGFTAGFILMFAGLILSLVRFLDKANFHSWEVILIAASFPCLAGGAHCLDLIDKRKQSQK